MYNLVEEHQLVPRYACPEHESQCQPHVPGDEYERAGLHGIHAEWWGEHRGELTP